MEKSNIILAALLFLSLLSCRYCTRVRQRTTICDSDLHGLRVLIIGKNEPASALERLKSIVESHEILSAGSLTIINQPNSTNSRAALIKSHDIVIDLFSSTENGSSGVHGGETTLAQSLSADTVRLLNRTLFKKDLPLFTVMLDNGSKPELMDYVNKHEKHYFLVETSSQPSSVRESEDLFIVTYLLWRLGVIAKYIAFSSLLIH